MCHGSDLLVWPFICSNVITHETRMHIKKVLILDSRFHCQICGILIKEPWEIIGLYSRNKEFFHSGHMHAVHRNACLTYLFIASNSLVVWAGRHKDISKHKPRPAKSWVVRLISKRRQCSAEAKDPILVITLPPPSPLPAWRLQTLMLCQALWTSVSRSSCPCYVSVPFAMVAVY